jgi:PleD family two-component response regulator
MARGVAESMRQTIASSPLKVTVSIGVAERHDEDRASTDILERARRALDAARTVP